MEIIGLGYLGLNVADVPAWYQFGRDVIGLDLGRVPSAEAWTNEGWEGKAADGSIYFRVDDWTWRIAVHPARDGEAEGLRYLGLEVAGPDQLSTAIAELQSAGYEARLGTSEEAVNRAVTAIGFTTDPAGNSIELFYGPQISNGYQNSKGIEFLTGDLGMGHINLFAKNYEASAKFYTEVLGFKLTDYYHVGNDQTVNFFHINERHHSIGLMKVAPIDGIHHFMLETTKLDMVGMAYDRVKQAGCAITASLGRHSNDQIVSFYVRSPSGVEVEIGWDAIRVTEDWVPRYRAPGDVWGHHGLTAEHLSRAGEDMSA